MTHGLCNDHVAYSELHATSRADRACVNSQRWQRAHLKPRNDLRGSQPRFNCCDSKRKKNQKITVSGKSVGSGTSRRRMQHRIGYTYVVETSTNGDSKGNEGADGTTNGSRVFSLDTKVGVRDTSVKQGGVRSVDERSRGTVEFSKEDEEECEGGRFGEVAVGANSTLKLSKFSGAVDLLVTRAEHLVRVARSKVDVGVESVDDDVGREV